jgi:hypothetical protein
VPCTKRTGRHFASIAPRPRVYRSVRTIECGAPRPRTLALSSLTVRSHLGRIYSRAVFPSFIELAIVSFGSCFRPSSSILAYLILQSPRRTQHPLHALNPPHPPSALQLLEGLFSDLLCSFNPRRPIEQFTKNPTLPSHYPTSSNRLYSSPFDGHDSHHAPLLMSYARHRHRPVPPNHSGSLDPRMDAPRTNAHAASYRHVAMSHIRPFLGVLYHYQFCCHHHPFDCECGHPADVKTSSPPPSFTALVLQQHLVPVASIPPVAIPTLHLRHHLIIAKPTPHSDPTPPRIPTLLSRISNGSLVVSLKLFFGFFILLSPRFHFPI